METFRITPYGLTVARTGLQPATVDFIINYLTSIGEDLADRLPTSTDQGDLDSVFFCDCSCVLHFSRVWAAGL